MLPNAEDEIKKNCSCESGIVNTRGSCWICAPELHEPARRRTKDAKTANRRLRCEKETQQQKIAALIEERDARNFENTCWLPKDPVHEEAARQLETAIQNCRSKVFD